ncbi:MAG: presenilin family intramembrane aspartyl protease [Candidatus Micrarchaeaceae archaeon]
MERRIEKRQLANILALFLIVQFGGLLFTFYSIPPNEIAMLSAQPVASASGTQLLYIVIYLVVAIAASALLFLFVLNRYHGEAAYKLMEAYAIGLPTFFLGYFFAQDLYPATLPQAVVAGLVSASALIIAKNIWPWIRNFATVIASIGIGVVIGLNGFSLSYLFMLVIAAYDYIAVFITKHMQVMAKAMSERNLAFLIGSSDLEVMPRSYLSKKEVGDIKASIKEGKLKDPTIKSIVKKGAYPTVSQVALGGGDLALPLMLVVGLYISYGNVFASILLILGAALGLLATMWLLQKYKVPLPAIPPLFAFMNLGLAAAFLALGRATALESSAFVILFALLMCLILFTLKRIRPKQANSMAKKRVSM